MGEARSGITLSRLRYTRQRRKPPPPLPWKDPGLVFLLTRKWKIRIFQPSLVPVWVSQLLPVIPLSRLTKPSQTNLSWGVTGARAAPEAAGAGAPLEELLSSKRRAVSPPRRGWRAAQDASANTAFSTLLPAPMVPRAGPEPAQQQSGWVITAQLLELFAHVTEKIIATESIK